jgi:hypothetical protein
MDLADRFLRARSQPTTLVTGLPHRRLKSMDPPDETGDRHRAGVATSPARGPHMRSGHRPLNWGNGVLQARISTPPRAPRLQPEVTGHDTTEVQPFFMKRWEHKKQGGTTATAESLPELKAWREVGWIFRDGNCIAIERQGEETRARVLAD